MIELLAIQDPPPYVQFMEEGEALGRAAYMAGFCIAAGMITGDTSSLDEVADDFARRATIAGTEGPLLNAAIERGVEREKAAIALMMDLGPDDGSERRQRREDQAAEYLGNGCGDLVVDYPEAFSLAAED